MKEGGGGEGEREKERARGLPPGGQRNMLESAPPRVRSSSGTSIVIGTVTGNKNFRSNETPSLSNETPSLSLCGLV